MYDILMEKAQRSKSFTKVMMTQKFPCLEHEHKWIHRELQRTTSMVERQTRMHACMSTHHNRDTKSTQGHKNPIWQYVPKNTFQMANAIDKLNTHFWYLMLQPPEDKWSKYLVKTVYDQ